ncbi:hypothetical protein ABZ208_04215 [Streptomyces sp. NPDC006208]|uniref:hypothetical protein n=1 Tax=Streptomyces sp. NPDC006208 TaxID=3156734 RepID=UPI0033A390A3
MSGSLAEGSGARRAPAGDMADSPVTVNGRGHDEQCARPGRADALGHCSPGQESAPWLIERIHDLKQSGATTLFFIDLRVRDGRLCLEGSAAGPRTDVEFFAAPESGPFEPAERKR